jgi:anti-anti-sigma factor
MPDNAFRARLRQEHGVPVLDLEGEINAFAEAALNAAFAQACLSDPPAVLLNFQHVTYVNSTGIALIVALLAQARKERRQLLVTGLSDHYRHIFSITRLADFMTIYDDEPSALARPSSHAAEV